MNGEIKTEYQGLVEIAQRLKISEELAGELVTRKEDRLQAKKVGKAWVLTEIKLQEWLNN